MSIMLGGEQNQFASLILCRDEFVEGMVALSSLVFFFLVQGGSRGLFCYLVDDILLQNLGR